MLYPRTGVRACLCRERAHTDAEAVVAELFAIASLPHQVRADFGRQVVCTSPENGIGNGGHAAAHCDANGVERSALLLRHGCSDEVLGEATESRDQLHLQLIRDRCVP